MVDMLYIDRSNDGIILNIHYNRLLNADREKDKNKIESAFSVVAQVCSDTDRPIPSLTDMFFPINKVPTVLDAEGKVTTDRVVRTKVYAESQGVSGIYNPDSTHMPGRMQLGDISSDGFSDILITVNSNEGPTTHLILNSPCTRSACSTSAKNARRRTFVHSQQGAWKFLLDDEDLGDSVADDIFNAKFTNFNLGDKKDYDITGAEYGETLKNYKNAQYAVFFDLMEDNMIDIMVITGDGGSKKVNALYNNIDQGNFFMKVRMVSDEKSYSPVAGCAMRSVVTLLNDRKIVVQGGSNGQSAYHSLQMPFVHIGVGKSNNFLELFTVGVYADGKRQLRTWTPIIPKSILFVVADMSSNVDNWGLTLLLNPTSKIPLILVCDGVFLLALGLVIIILHLYEQTEDEREKEKIDAFKYF